jgi:hypothetical protein
MRVRQITGKETYSSPGARWQWPGTYGRHRNRQVNSLGSSLEMEPTGPFDGLKAWARGKRENN